MRALPSAPQQCPGTAPAWRKKNTISSFKPSEESNPGVGADRGPDLLRRQYSHTNDNGQAASARNIGDPATRGFKNPAQSLNKHTSAESQRSGTPPILIVFQLRNARQPLAIYPHAALQTRSRPRPRRFWFRSSAQLQVI